jgi:hypothetical protein
MSAVHGSGVQPVPKASASPLLNQIDRRNHAEVRHNLAQAQRDPGHLRLRFAVADSGQTVDVRNFPAAAGCLCTVVEFLGGSFLGIRPWRFDVATG